MKLSMAQQRLTSAFHYPDLRYHVDSCPLKDTSLNDDDGLFFQRLATQVDDHIANDGVKCVMIQLTTSFSPEDDDHEHSSFPRRDMSLDTFVYYEDAVVDTTIVDTMKRFRTEISYNMVDARAQ